MQQEITVQAKPQTVLPLSMEREIGCAQSGKIGMENLAAIIRQSKSYRQLLEQEIERLRQQLTPCTPEEIIASLGKLLLHFPMTNMSTHEKTLLLEDYIEDLSDFPEQAVLDACKEYRLDPDNKFFPKSAVLVSLCKNKIYPLNKKIKIIKEAMQEADRVPEPRLSEEQIRALTADLRRSLTADITAEEKIQRTIDHMRSAGASEKDIQEFAEST